MAARSTEGMFPQDHLLRFDLTADAAAINRLFSDPYTYVPAQLTYGGETFDVGLHLKGQWGSLRYPDGKSAFKVDLDWSVPGQRLRGLEKVTLNNMVQDASCVHEALGYELLREAGAPAPRSAWAEVYLNGDYRGLYLHLESEDDQFLQRWFDDPEGNLYEGEYGQDVSLAWTDVLEQDELGADDVADRSDLVALGELLARPPTEDAVPDLEALVDVDRTLAGMAGEAVIGHWDGYFYSANNWRIYHDPSTGKFTLLVSGIDQTFGWSGGLWSPVGDLSWWMLQIPSIRARYDLALWDMADRLAALDVEPKALADMALFYPSFEADPYREVSPETMRSSVEATIDWAAARPNEVIDQL